MAINARFEIDFKSLIDPTEYFEELKHPIGRAITKAMEDVSDGATVDVRNEVRQNFRKRMGKGSNFEKSFKSRAWHGKGEFSYAPTATIQANAKWADVFEDGSTIRPSRYAYLAVPTEEADRLGLDKQKLNGRTVHKSSTARASEMFGDNLFTLRTGGGLFLAAKDKDDKLLLLFHLQRQSRQKKRISIEHHARVALALLPLKFREHFPKT